MELKLVYRFLRQVADWTLEGFYSEVHVEGYENVSKTDPLILASTHHNEIIDTGVLAATIPHRRHVAFWTKESMFKNPISGAMFSSSGAIPVKRNPNKASPPGSSSTSASSTTPTKNGSNQASLFLASSKALAKGDVIGVFPEGTSYTMPGIVQVMPGAAWAAVDFVRWVGGGRDGEVKVKGSKDVKIFPVAIVYTDKSQYLSRLVVRFGKPIEVSQFVDEADEANEDEESASKSAVKNIMVEVENQMKALSINASNWDALYASQVAKDILWNDSKKIALKDWVPVSQRLIDVFEKSSQEANTISLVASLSKYHSLLYFTGVEHSLLHELYPLGNNSRPVPSRFLKSLACIPQTLVAVVSTALFIPPMLMFRPAYMTGLLMSKLLGAKGEEESPAQFKAVFGGVGIGLGYGLWTLLLRRLGWWQKFWPLLIKDSIPGDGRLKRAVTTAAAAYGGLYFMVKWHNLLVKSNYRRLKKVITLTKLFLGLKFIRPATTEELKAFVRSPPPPVNPFIRKAAAQSVGSSTTYDRATAPKPRFGSLIRPLLDSRAEATSALREYFQNQESEELEIFLQKKGATIP